MDYYFVFVVVLLIIKEEMLEKDQEDLDLDFEKDSNGINRVYLYNNFFIVILKNLYLK